MKRYGWSEYYTLGQVRATVQDSRFAADFIECPVALFCKRSDFESAVTPAGDIGYESFRAEIASVYFALREYHSEPGNFFTSRESWEKGISSYIPDRDDMKWAHWGGNNV